MTRKRKELSVSQKVFKVAHVIITVMIVILAILQLLDVWMQAIDVLIPLSGVNMLCQTYDQWDKNRHTAYITLGAAIVVFLCVAAVLSTVVMYCACVVAEREDERINIQQIVSEGLWLLEYY